MISRWQVQTLIGYGWDNVWSIEGEPETFATKRDAERALEEHLKDCRAANLGHKRSDFRITEVD